MGTKAIVNLIVDSVTSRLTEILQNEIDSTDITRAGLIKPGLLQDDPTVKSINVLVFPNDPRDEATWRDQIVSPYGNGTNNPPPYELGGGEMWYRRGVVEVEAFFKSKVSKDEARDAAGVILARTQLAIATTPMFDLVDDFGEQALQMYVLYTNISQGGGDTQAIWYIRLWYQVLTGKI